MFTVYINNKNNQETYKINLSNTLKDGTLNLKQNIVTKWPKCF